eukprot:gene19491-28995_t
MAFAADGTLFFGGLTTDGLYRWAPSGGGPVGRAVPLVVDPARLHWVDTFGFDNRGVLWLTTNKLDQWFFGGMDWSGGSGANFRILRAHPRSRMTHAWDLPSWDPNGGELKEDSPREYSPPFSICDTDGLDMTGTKEEVHARLWACFNQETNLLVRHPDYEAYDPAPIDAQH